MIVSSVGKSLYVTLLATWGPIHHHPNQHRIRTASQYRPSTNREAAIQTQLSFAATFTDTANTFYEILSSRTCIRLLNIGPSTDSKGPLVCTFEELELRDASGYSGYSALSYRWGDDKPTYPVVLNGKIIYVRRNLWDFLMQARDNGWTNRLWVDALCINQEDIPERESQVTMMGEIYSRACNVLVWLGPLTSDETQALMEMDLYLDAIKEYTKLGWRHNLWTRFSENARIGVQSLVRNPYWSRKWIVQELRLAGPNTSVVTGTGYAPFSKVANFFSQAQSIIPQEDLGWYMTNLRKYQNILAREDKMTLESLSLEMALLMYGSHICTDPRDNIYGLLGISSSSDFPVDYTKPLVHLYWEALAHICKDKDCAQLLRSTAKSLQQQMQLSDDEVWERWTELVKENHFVDLWGYQFVEAIRMIIGELARITPQRDERFSSKLSSLLAFHLDYADVAKNGFRTSSQKLITTLYELFNHIASVHPSTLSTPFESSTYGPELGDYFVGNIVDASPISTSEWEAQRQLYTEGSPLIPFPLDQISAMLRWSRLHMIDHGRRSEMKHLILAANTKSQHDELLSIAKDDIVCMFSGYQAALVIRRLSEDKLLCGFAVVKFKPTRWLGRAVTRILSSRTRSTSESEMDAEDWRTSRTGKRSPCTVHIFMKPHSLISIQNWKVEVGRPYRGPFLEHCKCEPGGGGCV